MNIYTLDENFEVKYLIDLYESFIWTDRFNACGDFELYFPASSYVESMLPKDWYLQNSDSDHTMIIEQHRVTVDADDGDWLTVTGRSLESILERRVIWGQASFVDANLQTAIITLLNQNVINPSDPNRKIPNFTYELSEDTRITSLTLTAQYVGDNLYEVIQNICDEQKIGFKVILNPATKKLVFSLYVGEDRTYDQSDRPYVVFSPKFDNLLSSEYFTSKETYKNAILVGGEGEGDQRTYGAYSLGQTGMERREMYYDANDVSSSTDGATLTPTQYLSQLQQRGKEELLNYKEVVTLTGEMDAQVMFTYKDDYYCGDIVQVEDSYGHTNTARITEMIFSHDDDGYRVYPTFEEIEPA